MSWRTTWLLFSGAVLLGAFIFFFERHVTPGGVRAEEGSRKLLNFRLNEVTSVQLRRTNQFLLRVERTNESWRLTAPVAYAAQGVDIFLKQLLDLTSQAYITPEELSASRQTIAAFGLDVPLATVTLLQGGRRYELSFGRKTPAGDQIYLQFLDSPGIHVVAGEIFEHLPRSVNDWRDNSLVNLAGLGVNRFETRIANRGFGVTVNPTNGQYYLFRPAAARADRIKVHSLLHRTQTAQILQFVTEDPGADIEAYGLNKPEAELVYGVGTNDVIVVQFGKSPAGNTNLVYARRLSDRNIVLVSRDVLDAVLTSGQELRDRHLFSFGGEEVDTIEVANGTNDVFAARRQNTGVWILIDPQATLLDTDLVNELLKFMSRLEGNVEKDLVADFTPYGLATPPRQYSLKATLTNTTGALTNRLIAQLDVGARQGDKVFVRRADEPLTVYSISTDDIYRLPAGAWQLRDRRVWSFSTNQVTRLLVRHGGAKRELLRNAAGEWSLAPGSTGVIKPFALEELLYQLGQLRAYLWVSRGDEARTRFGFGDASDQLTIDLKMGDQADRKVIEFGGFSPVSKFPYATTQIDGQTYIFEFPSDLYWKLHRDLIAPLRAPASL